MKREFKLGDRVLVRNNDLREWEAGVLIKQHDDKSHPFYVCLEESTKTFMWSQCRHIDDFRTGDKVQVSDDGIKWEDAIYAVHVPNDLYEHCVFSENMVFGCKLCRWHPSMPWAEKEEPLTLEQRVEALERKLNER